METTLEAAARAKDPDAELVAMAKGGCREAFDTLFARHRQFVFNVCYRVIGSRDDAVDVTQNTFVKAYRALSSFRGSSSFRSWLYRIAVNECRGLLRRKPVSDMQAIEEPEAVNSDERPEVRQALAELPVDLRTTLVLFYWQGMSCRELGLALGCSEGAARVRLHRARTQFKQKYTEILA